MSSTPPPIPDIPYEEYGEHYFQSHNYADRPLGKYSMYWFARRYYAALLKRYAPPGGGKLLEMGCGLGHLTGLLQEDFQCVALDLADYAIQQTRLNAPKAQAMVHNADDLSIFPDGDFAAVVALHLLEHLPRPDQTMREVFRILRPGGAFLYATPNPHYSLRRFKDPQTDAIGKDPTHINVQSVEQWRAWGEAAGFRQAAHFGDGLWDVPYLPLIPKGVQFGLFGLPALAQVMTRTTWTPLAWGVNQIGILQKP